MELEHKHISVIIPTYNRGNAITDLLRGLEQQDIDSSEFRVIVVDDGSERPVSDIVNPEEYSFDIEIHRHDDNRARAATCNTGIKAASGEIVVILDDDVSIPTNLLRLHSEFHRNPENVDSAAIGALEWGTGPEVTPGMYFLENSEKCFHLYPRILHDNLPYLNTGNFSIRRSFLLENGLFDEDFREYGHEEIELGERLRAKGLKMLFLSGANVRHHKILDLNAIIKRQFTLGKMLALYYQKNSNGSMGINSLAVVSKLVRLRTEELNREVAMLSGLEDYFEKKDNHFRELPEYHLYSSKLSEVIGTYNCLGVVEGLKALIPQFKDAFPIILSSIMLMEKGDAQAALVEGAKADNMLPNFLPVHLHMAALLGKIGKLEESCKLLDLLRDHYQDDLSVRINLTESKSAMGDAGASMEICKEIISQPTVNPLWRRRFVTLLVRVMLDHGLTDDAFKEAMRCREAYKSDPYLQYNLASLFEKKRIFNTAEDMFNSLLSYLDSREDCFEFKKLRSGIHYHIGMINLQEKCVSCVLNLG